MNARAILLCMLLGIQGAWAAEPPLLARYALDDLAGATTADAVTGGKAAVFSAEPAWSAEDKAPLPGNKGSVTLPKGAALTIPVTERMAGLKSLTVSVWIKDAPAGTLLTNGEKGMLRWSFPQWVRNNQGGTQGGVAGVFAPEARFPLMKEEAAGKPGTPLLAGWHHWAMVYDSTEPLYSITYYRDGEVILKTRTGGWREPGPVTLDPAGIVVGPFANALDDLRIYGSTEDGSGALSQWQMLAVAGKQLTPAEYLGRQLALPATGKIQNQSLVSVLAFLRSRSVWADPAREGIRIELDVPAEVEAMKLSVELDGTGLEHALAAVAKAAQCKLEKVGPNTVRLTAAGK